MKDKPSCLAGKTEHNYFRNEDNQIECRTCGLLKTTIEGIKNDPTTADDTIDRDLLPSIIETTERIVIDFANLTGRETESRAEFRGLVYGHLEDFVNDFENRLEEYRNSPDVWKHVGISKWRNWGEQNGYFKFFEDKTKQEALAEERRTIIEKVFAMIRDNKDAYMMPETEKRFLGDIIKTLLK